MTTKEQELKALDRIRKIVNELGNDSYIAMAFDGCFEIAEENIQNDFGCSMKQRAEKAEKDVENLEIEIQNRKSVIYELTAENTKLKEKVLSLEEAGMIKRIIGDARHNATIAINDTAEKIVEFADNPNSTEFRQAVRDNRINKKLLSDCDMLIQRLLETMK